LRYDNSKLFLFFYKKKKQMNASYAGYIIDTTTTPR